ncbi:large-conductance mechanosensitive channel protein MscL [Clostridium botulinum]|uniref:Large-conductance mechanosensitive channel n=1 Tax=Clostridium botulinum (strain Langeland / NCTC 10281 / Type F) TaxID=441772 RepID=A7GAV8_CLOBL|nr:large-conductance mechanosensitive channel protein MscL [Clostridium botulinum]ABS41445.1 large conductance mechanosensitive channel protein [Clostridium botulinum F str. Langeland]ADF98378.1 large conductance mechanosensitive channel protein [Clostridium botulinum F str. 230613]NEZ50885.1 large-conductance mechanosensitive channel protein MscL [Clostridium botulinum F str. Langeland]NFF58826.1 large-conductance mechanosensitive channel protein MscL [Clostridium botulinum]NFL12682.1 large-c
MNKMIKEFKEFAVKGNAMELAIGVVIGGAFGKIVTSLVEDIIMPLVGLLIGGIDFTGLNFSMNLSGKTVVSIKYGNFIQAAVNFLIISFSIFVFIKLINKFNKKEEEVKEEPKISNEEILLTEIRDLLKKSNSQ